MPSFPPVLPRHGRHRLRRAVRRRRHAVAASLAVTAAALAAAVPPDTDRAAHTAGAEAARPPDPPERRPRAAGPGPDPAAEADHSDRDTGAESGGDGGPRPGDLVAVPVRIADAEAARLLAPGDLIDVLASPMTQPRAPGLADETAVRDPEVIRARRVAHRARVEEIPPDRDTVPDDVAPGALVVLSVTPATAADLAGAAAGSWLAVTRW